MNWIPSVIGGVLGLVSSIVVMIIGKVWDRMGKLRIYYQILNGEESFNSFGFVKATDGKVVFIVPMVFELQNTTNTPRVFRDISINLYYQGCLVDTMTQVGQIKNKKDAEEYGSENQSYSFVIQPKSIKKVYGSFMYSPEGNSELEYRFDELRLVYFDERNKEVIYHVRYIHEPWKVGKIEGDKEWIILDDNSRYKKRRIKKESIEEIVPMTEDKLTYMQMIQEPICRMSTISAIFKGFAATIVAGIAVLQYSEVNKLVLGLSFIPIMLFFFLDIYYLKLEKKYRYLYEQVRLNKHIVDFSMKTCSDNKVAKSRIVDCIKSPSIWLFYPPIIVILLIVFLLKMREVI